MYRKNPGDSSIEKRTILEVGPGVRPMHHRSQGGLELAEGENYIGLDQPGANFDHEIWKSAREKYGERVLLVRGDRANMPEVLGASVDELVALGADVQGARIVGEFNRVLKPGGILRLGTLSTHLQKLMDIWAIRLERLGYTRLPEEKLNYDYIPEDKTGKRPYVVVSFRKGPSK